MEEGSPEAERASKRLKTCSSVGLDRISTLPNPILHHILSFVGTKKAVQTSILSKKWKNVWTSMPYLFFDDQDFHFNFGRAKRIHLYTNFVDAVLSHHDKSNILQFRFVWHYGFDKDIVDRWMRHAIACNTRELDLYLRKHPSDDEMLLQLLYSCRWLQVLRLAAPLNRPPILTGFDKLKTLLLSSIKSPQDSFGEQLIGCPALNNLSLYSCTFKRVQVSSAKLESLTLHDCNVSDHEIQVSTPGLLSFEYVTPNELDTCCLENLSSLISATIGIGRCCKEGDRVAEILGGLYNVRKITFSAFNIKCKRNKEKFFTSLPTFTNLKLVEMMEVPNKAIKAITEILQHLPNLENLRIKDKRGGRKPSTRKHTKHLQKLKTVVIDGFGGSSSEIGLLTFLVRNAGGPEKKATLSLKGW